MTTPPGVFNLNAAILLAADILTGVGGIGPAIATQTAGGAVQRILVAPGAEVAWDNCQCGQLSASVSRLYPSRRFPDDWSLRKDGNCSQAYVIADMNIQMVRCVPGVDTDGNPPTPVSLSAAALIQFEDMYVIRQTASCYLQTAYDAPTSPSLKIAEWLIGDQTPLGPEGGCAGSELHFKVAWWADCSCPG